MKTINGTEEINKFFEKKSGYTEDVVNKIKNFYFNECNVECGTTRLEKICNVSSNISVQI